MGIEITKRQWEQILERLSKAESQVRKLESRLELIEKKLKPAEVYRMVKQQEHEETLTSENPALKPKI
jgi:hypothetical protein